MLCHGSHTWPMHNLTQHQEFLSSRRQKEEGWREKEGGRNGSGPSLPHVHDYCDYFEPSQVLFCFTTETRGNYLIISLLLLVMACVRKEAGRERERGKGRGALSVPLLQFWNLEDYTYDRHIVTLTFSFPRKKNRSIGRGKETMAASNVFFPWFFYGLLGAIWRVHVIKAE